MFRIVLIFLSIILIVQPRNQTQAQTISFDTLPPCNLNAYTNRPDLHIGAMAINLQTGDGCAQNLDTVFHTASVGKVYVAGALYTLVAQGLVSFDTELTFTNYYLMRGRDDCLNEARVGESIRIGDLSDIMIWCSDNSATWMLMDYIGWDTVQSYIDSLQIADIGTVVPYSEVDHIKLILLDERWADVPANIASQYYRRNFSDKFIPPELYSYFDVIPSYTDQEIRQANAEYQANYTLNTMTPRSMAIFLLKLWSDSQQGGTVEAQVANWLFNTMLLTQLVYSTQEFPGNVYVGSKNGYDLGFRAEVNITINDFSTTQRTPSTISMVFAKYQDITQEDVPFRFMTTDIELLLKDASYKIADLLFPFRSSASPTVVTFPTVRNIALNAGSSLQPCWNSYVSNNFIDGLEACWSAVPMSIEFAVNDAVGFGVILRELGGQDTRVTFVYTLPDGTHWSFQYQRFFRDSVAFAIFEPLHMSGVWRIDVYYNLVPIFSQRVYVS